MKVPPLVAVVAAAAELARWAASQYALDYLIPILVVERGWPLNTVAIGGILRNAIALGANVPNAKLSGILGPRPALVLTEGLFVPILMGMAFAPAPLTIILLNGSLGFLAPILAGSAMIYADLAKAGKGGKADKRATADAFAFVISAQLVGLLIGFALIVAYGTLGWSVTLLICAAMMGAATLFAAAYALARVSCKATPRQDAPDGESKPSDAAASAKTAADSSKPPPAAARGTLRQRLGVYLSPGFLSVGALNLSQGVTNAGYVVVTALSAASDPTLSSELLGIALLVHTCAGLVLTPQVPRLMSKLQYAPTVAVAFALVLGSGVVLAAVRPLSPPVLLVFAFGPTMSTFVLKVAGRVRVGHVAERTRTAPAVLLGVLRTLNTGVGKSLGGLGAVFFAEVSPTAAWAYLALMQALCFAVFAVGYRLDHKAEERSRRLSDSARLKLWSAVHSASGRAERSVEFEMWLRVLSQQHSEHAITKEAGAKFQLLARAAGHLGGLFRLKLHGRGAPHANPALLGARARLLVLGSCSARAAARAAVRAYRHPARKPLGWEADDWYQEATNLFVPTHAGNHHVHVTLRTPAGKAAAPLACVLHGWGGNAYSMRELASALLSAGCRVALIDLPVCGRSSGRRTDLVASAAAVREALLFLHAAHGPVEHVVGYAAGGAAALLAADMIRGEAQRAQLGTRAHGATRAKGRGASTGAHGSEEAARPFAPRSVTTIGTARTLAELLEPISAGLALPPRVADAFREEVRALHAERHEARLGAPRAHFLPYELAELLDRPSFSLLMLRAPGQRQGGAGAGAGLALQPEAVARIERDGALPGLEAAVPERELYDEPAVLSRVVAHVRDAQAGSQRADDGGLVPAAAARTAAPSARGGARAGWASYFV